MFLRETAAGTYRLSALVLATMTAEIPITIVIATVCMTIPYWMVGMMPTAFNYFAYLGVHLLNVFLAQVQLICSKHLILMLVIQICPGIGLGEMEIGRVELICRLCTFIIAYKLVYSYPVVLGSNEQKGMQRYRRESKEIWRKSEL